MRAVGLPDSTPFHPGYGSFIVQGASQRHEHSGPSTALRINSSRNPLVMPPFAIIVLSRSQRYVTVGNRNDGKNYNNESTQTH
jgi:hypothetical protein